MKLLSTLKTKIYQCHKLTQEINGPPNGCHLTFLKAFLAVQTLHGLTPGRAQPFPLAASFPCELASEIVLWLIKKEQVSLKHSIKASFLTFVKALLFS